MMRSIGQRMLLVIFPGLLGEVLCALLPFILSFSVLKYSGAAAFRQAIDVRNV